VCSMCSLNRENGKGELALYVAALLATTAALVCRENQHYAKPRAQLSTASYMCCNLLQQSKNKQFQFVQTSLLMVLLLLALIAALLTLDS
jgi:hypothetical protein